MWKPAQKKCRLRDDTQQLHKEPAYLKWLHEVKQPECFACGNINGIELHHLRKKGQFGRIDHQCIPLCSSCHRTDKFSAHGFDSKAFNDKYKEEMLEEAKRLYKEYLNDNR